MDWLRRLTDIGFRQVGSWTLVSGSPVCRLASDASSSNVLYAFVSEGEVLYVGKTTMPLGKRMYGYQNPGPSQLTNISGHARIRELLEQGRPVEVVTLTDTAALEYGGFRVNLAAGLEDTLIGAIRPPWNRSGK